MAQGDNIIINVTGNTRQLEKDIAKVANKSISLNLKGFGQPLGKISGQLGEFEKSLEASNARVLAFGASAGAIYAIEKALVETLKTAIKVEKALADINVILNASSGSLKNFGAELFNIAKNTGQSFDAVAAAATELSRQGLGIEQTLKRTSDALILTRLSGLDTVSSVEALTAAINSFSKSALDSTMIVNKLAAVDAAFAVSSADLAEAIKRVGSSAEDANVSFDELIGIVTAAQQITSRGGAVIGNSLKTIFTRLQRTDTLDALEGIGVAVRDQQGNILPLLQILSQLAKTYDNLSSTQRASIAETVGGVFQINILKAALTDLNSEYSIYSRALGTSVSATDEAIRRNEQLNQTLDALINKTLVNLAKVGGEIGQDVFGPALRKILGGLNVALEGFGGESEDVGSRIGKGLLKGLGDFLSGPGLVLGGLALFKVFERLTVFAADAFKTITGLNTKLAEQQMLQSQILSILSKNPAIIQQINNGEVSLVQVHKTLLSLIEQETVALNQQVNIANKLSQSLSGAGVRVASKGPTRGIATKAAYGGYIPNYSLTEELQGVMGSSDYTSRQKRMASPLMTTLNGKSVYANNQEMKVPTKSIYERMGLPSGTRPKNPAEKYGILNPKQQQLLGFSSGFVPNFKAKSKLSADELLSEISSLSNVSNFPVGQSDLNGRLNRLASMKNSLQQLRIIKAAISKENFSGKDFVKSNLDARFNNLKSFYDKEKDAVGSLRYRASGNVLKTVESEADFNNNYSSGFIPNFAKTTVDLNDLDASIGSKFAVLVGSGGKGRTQYTQGVGQIPLLKGVAPEGTSITATLRTQGVFPLKKGNIDQAEDEFDELLSASIGPGLRDFANRVGSNILGDKFDGSSNPFVQKLGQDVKGLIFEKAVRAAIAPENLIDNAQAPFDFDPAPAYRGLSDLFDLKNLEAVEAKITEKAALGGGLPNKILNRGGQGSALVNKIRLLFGKEAVGKKRGGKLFGGFIPNFVQDLQEAREEAFLREKAATGLPDNQIKLVKNRVLASSANPFGEAVINRRDEPSGTAMEGIRRFKSIKDARRAGMPDASFMGYIPNFAARGPGGRFVGRGTGEPPVINPNTANEIEKAGSNLQSRLLLASFAFSTLGGVAEEFTKGFGSKATGTINALSSGASAFATLAGVLPGKIGAIVGAFVGVAVAADGLIKTFKAKGPELAIALESLTEKNQQLTDSTDRYLQTYNKLTEAINDVGSDNTKQIIKLNQELSQIAFDLPAEYRKEILSIRNLNDLQEKIGQIRQKELQQLEGLKAAESLQKIIDESQGLGKELFGTGRSVLNRPGAGANQATAVRRDLGAENFLKLAENSDILNKSQEDLISTLEKSYGLSEQFGAVLRQLSTSDFEQLRSVLIETANETKNLSEQEKLLTKQREQESKAIQELNKKIMESKARLSDLSRSLLSSINVSRQLQSGRAQTRRDVGFKELENIAALNKSFQSDEAQAQSQYLVEQVKIQKDYIDESSKAVEEANSKLISKFDEVINKAGGATGADTELIATQLADLGKQLSDPNINVSPEYLEGKFKEIIAPLNLSADEQQKLLSATKEEGNDLSGKLVALKELMSKNNQLNELQLQYAKKIAQDRKDLQKFGGFQGFVDPESRKGDIERYIASRDTIRTSMDAEPGSPASEMDIMRGRAYAEQATYLQKNLGLEAGPEISQAIDKAMAKSMGIELTSYQQDQETTIAKGEKRLKELEGKRSAAQKAGQPTEAIDKKIQQVQEDIDIAKAQVKAIDKEFGPKDSEQRQKKLEEVAKKQREDALKNRPVGTDEFNKQMEDIKAILKTDEEKIKPLTEEAFARISQEAIDKNVEAIGNLLKEIQAKEGERAKIEEEGAKERERIIAEQEKNQNLTNIVSARGALTASGTSLFGAKEEAKATEQRIAGVTQLLSGGLGAVPGAINLARGFQPNYDEAQAQGAILPMMVERGADAAAQFGGVQPGSTKELIDALKSDTRIAQEAVRGTATTPEQFIKTLEESVAKSGKQGREAQVVGDINKLLQTLQPVKAATQTDISQEASDRQNKNAAAEIEKRREEDKKAKQQSSEKDKANTDSVVATSDLITSLEQLSSSINAFTEQQNTTSATETEPVVVNPIDINVNVQGAISQIPDATSQQTVKAIENAVNQIVPGLISRIKGAPV